MVRTVRQTAAGDLQSGDVILARDGQQLTVASTEIEEVKVRIHNLIVARLFNYAVGNAGLLVNNMRPIEEEDTAPLT